MVDHLVPHLGLQEWFWKEGNYIPLCSPCHGKVTRLFDEKYKQGDSIEPKVAWLNEMRAHHEIVKGRTFSKVKVVPTESPKHA